MNMDDAIAIASSYAGISAHNLAAAEIDGFSSHIYISVLDDNGRPLVGGVAYVVDKESSVVNTVPGSMPPALNIEGVGGVRDEDRSS